jgi:peptidoglycan hydrolase CwlO-like protein
MKVFTYIGIAAMVALAFYLGSKRAGITMSEDYGARNAILQHECDSLKNIIAGLQSDISTHYNAVDSLECHIEKINAKINGNRTKYEKATVRINGMHTDSLYVFFTGYVSRQ